MLRFDPSKLRSTATIADGMCTLTVLLMCDHQISQFVDDDLIHCTNVAEGQPATQSSTYAGAGALRVVDGEGVECGLPL